MKEWTPAITAVRADRREKGGKRGVRTCGDAGNDEPEDASNSAEDPAPVRDGRVRVAIGRVESVVADLDHGRAVVRHLHAQHDDPAHTHTHTHVVEQPCRTAAQFARMCTMLTQYRPPLLQVWSS